MEWECDKEVDSVVWSTEEGSWGEISEKIQIQNAR